MSHEPESRALLVADTRRFGDGESASMAIAFTRRWTIAVDEKGPVRRLVLEELGEDLLVSTPKLLTRAVREGVIRAAQIPELRAILAANRYALEALEAGSE